MQDAPLGSCGGDCFGKMQGLEVEADAILDGAFTNSPESYVIYHRRVEKTQGERGVSSVENIQSQNVWMDALGKHTNSQTDTLSELTFLHSFKELVGNGNMAKELHSKAF